MVYGQAFPISDEALSPDFVLPIGKGKIEREGKHISLVSHSIGVKICLEAAKELEQSGIDCEVSGVGIHRSCIANLFSQVVNLRTLRPLDGEIIKTSVKKTHHLLAVEFGWPQCGMGSEIITRICESKFKTMIGIEEKSIFHAYEQSLVEQVSVSF